MRIYREFRALTGQLIVHKCIEVNVITVDPRPEHSSGEERCLDLQQRSSHPKELIRSSSGCEGFETGGRTDPNSFPLYVFTVSPLSMSLADSV